MDVTTEVVSLVKKAEAATDANDALKYSQAAYNAANAMACVESIQMSKDRDRAKT